MIINVECICKFRREQENVNISWPERVYPLPEVGDKVISNCGNVVAEVTRRDFLNIPVQPREFVSVILHLRAP